MTTHLLQSLRRVAFQDVDKSFGGVGYFVLCNRCRVLQVLLSASGGVVILKHGSAKRGLETEVLLRALCLDMNVQLVLLGDEGEATDNATLVFDIAGRREVICGPYVWDLEAVFSSEGTCNAVAQTLKRHAALPAIHPSTLDVASCPPIQLCQTPSVLLALLPLSPASCFYNISEDALRKGVELTMVLHSSSAALLLCVLLHWHKPKVLCLPKGSSQKAWLSRFRFLRVLFRIEIF